MNLLHESDGGHARHVFWTGEPLDLLQEPRRFPKSTRTQPPETDTVPEPDREQKTVLREFPLVEADPAAEFGSYPNRATEGEGSHRGCGDGRGGDVGTVKSVGMDAGVREQGDMSLNGKSAEDH